jgi:hypothetical protein
VPSEGAAVDPPQAVRRRSPAAQAVRKIFCFIEGRRKRNTIIDESYASGFKKRLRNSRLIINL